ncbi:MAG: hypothetical protein B6I35_14550 [Anaerolineaceae bacterium 4572_32.2]|nr:MAG: hypothetical protein B6I35_14550 [Anaerolineaceae bacterium 4572_32.2]
MTNAQTIQIAEAKGRPMLHWVGKVQLRGIRGTPKLDGESYTLSEQIQYTDIWANDTYLQFMYERLLLLKELLTTDGMIYLHCDWRRIHHLRCLLDEVLGSENFINEIIWQHQIMGGSHDKRFPKAHETILWYAKGSGYRLRSENSNVRVPFSDYVLQSMKQDEKGWYYERRRMSRKATPAEAAAKAHTRTYVESPDVGTVATDVWADMLSYQELPNERQGLDLYPTQKTVKLLTRLISAASDPGDLILDCFIGSGTTAAVAQKLGRRWIAADVNKGAIQTTSKRLQAIIRQQVEAGAVPQQMAFETQTSEVSEDLGGLAGLTHSFSVYRVNDYDLQIQHNEAVNLAVEMIGIERVKTDAFFDGTLGRRLVKIVPFNHPLTLLDLQLAQDELKARPDEERDVVLVCLGKETSVDAWLAEYNKRRPVNKIEVIELRTDQKYGKFFIHQPAQARVRVERQTSEVSEDLGGLLVIEIEDFISPSIVERLEMDTPLFKAQIPDWRAMVDVVLIDTAYDGQTFNIVLSDVPERKNDLVSGRYELPAPEGVAPGSATTVAVKIIDMLGEEVLVTAEVGPA